MPPLKKRLWISLLGVIFCLPVGQAQQSQPSKDSQNKPGAPSAPLSPIPLGVDNSQQQGQGTDQQGNDTSGGAGAIPAVRTSTPAITGAQLPSVGSLSSERSLIVSSFQSQELFDSNANFQPGSSDREAVTGIAGFFGIQHMTANSQFLLQYSGGGFFYSHATNLNSPYHQMAVSQTIGFRRWHLFFSDQVDYLPEASFGFGGLGGGLGGENSQLINLLLLNPKLPPSQTIQTGKTQRLGNVVVGEAQFALSRRASLTATASYSVLHFFENGFLEPKNTALNFGYNYALSEHNTVAVSYGLNLYRFNPSSETINDHVIQFSYARRILNRMVWNIGAGPQFDTIHNLTVAGTGATSQTFWSLDSGLQYQIERATLSVHYSHYLSGGAGILHGAESQTVDFSARRLMSRQWSLGGNFGFSQNQNLIGAGGGGTQNTYHNWYGGMTLSRQLGRTSDMFVRYWLQRQTLGGTSCASTVCVSNFVRHQISIGFDWTPRPVPLD